MDNKVVKAHERKKKNLNEQWQSPVRFTFISRAFSTWEVRCLKWNQGSIKHQKQWSSGTQLIYRSEATGPNPQPNWESGISSHKRVSRAVKTNALLMFTRFPCTKWSIELMKIKRQCDPVALLRDTCCRTPTFERQDQWIQLNRLCKCWNLSTI